MGPPAVRGPGGQPGGQAGHILLLHQKAGASPMALELATVMLSDKKLLCRNTEHGPTIGDGSAMVICDQGTTWHGR